MTRYFRWVLLVGLAAVSYVLFEPETSRMDPTTVLPEVREVPPMQSRGIKTPKRSFNHVQDFALEEGMLWHRSRAPEVSEWRRLPFDGAIEGREARELYVGGANIIVIDDQAQVHYKKVLDEVNDGETYSFTDTSQEWNWQPHWFSLPYVHAPYNFVNGGHLQLPQDYRAAACSHLGLYAYEYHDPAGRKHWVDVGTTHLFVLAGNGRDILIYDPWIPPHTTVKLPVWESASATFYARGMEADASTLLCIGYRVAADGTRSVAAYVTEWDVDNAGWHPTRPYSYFADQAADGVRVIPMPSWEEIALPAEHLTDAVTVVQLGRGSEQRELRIEGWNQKGELGYFARRLQEAEWRFSKEGETPIGRELNPERAATLVHAPRVQSWRGSLAGYRVDLEDFGLHSHQASLVVSQGEEELCRLLVYRRMDLVTAGLTGRDSYSFDLVLREGEIPESLQSAFHGERSVTSAITLREDGQLSLQPTWRAWLAGARFDWVLQPKKRARELASLPAHG